MKRTVKNMATTTFKPGNRFSPRVSVAAAAVEWQGLSSAQQDLVTVEEGLPYLTGVPDLTLRAEALAEAAAMREISGATHTEDGYARSAEHMLLDRVSVAAYVKKTQSWLPPERPQHQPPAPPSDKLLRVEEVLNRLGVSRSTFYRGLKAGKFEQAHVEDPPRWRASYIERLVADPGANNEAANTEDI